MFSDSFFFCVEKYLANYTSGRIHITSSLLTVASRIQLITVLHKKNSLIFISHAQKYCWVYFIQIQRLFFYVYQIFVYMHDISFLPTFKFSEPQLTIQIAPNQD